MSEMFGAEHVAWEKPLPAQETPVKKRFEVQDPMFTVGTLLGGEQPRPMGWRARAWFDELSDAVEYAQASGLRFVRVIDRDGCDA